LDLPEKTVEILQKQGIGMRNLFKNRLKTSMII
jgi:hypothetical protein